MDITLLAIVAVATLLLYGTLKVLVQHVQEMAVRKIQVANDQQKKLAAEWYSSNRIEETVLTEAIASKKEFDSVKF